MCYVKYYNVENKFCLNWFWFYGFCAHRKRLKLSIVIARIFVTMFGYPPRCERNGLSHACTLSIACWLAGGTSEEGCGANPWIVACCVVRENYYQNVKDVSYGDDGFQSLK